MKEKLLFIAPEIETVVFVSKSSVLNGGSPTGGNTGEGMSEGNGSWGD